MSSGGTVYGTPDVLPIPETHRLKPLNSYGIVKVAIEQYLEMYSRAQGVSAIVIRPSNPLAPGKGIPASRASLNSLRRIVAGDALEIWGDGSVVRDYFSVGDLAELCVLASASRKEGAYNAGSEIGTSINEVIESIRAVTEAVFKVIYKLGRAFDVPSAVLDCARAQADYGWECKIGFEAELCNTWSWMKRHAL